MSLISTQNVIAYYLANGFKILYEVNRASPVVSLYVGVKVGSSHETDREAGLSHVLEHMVFKGTRSYGPGQIAMEVEGSGGELNAYTSLDQTVYYINLSSRYWRKGLSMIKEMVADATIDPVELDREREVILEELRRGKDNPRSVVSELLFKLAFQRHTYGRPIIGFERTIKGFDSTIVKDFYHRWYGPRNMILGVCGDVDDSALRAAIEEEFGVIADRSVPTPDVPAEPPITGPRYGTEKNPIQTNYLEIGFPIPAINHPDVPALDLLAHLLGSGDTSRLTQVVKEKKQLVTSIHAAAYTPRDPGLFLIDAVVPPGKLAKAMPAIIEEVAYCKEHLFLEESLARAKAGMEAGLHYEKETCEGTTRKWISYETVAGDFKFEEKYYEALRDVTLHDIREAARKYLDEGKTSTALVTPPHAAASVSLKSPAHKLGKNFERVSEMDGMAVYRLASGVKIITSENHRVPLVALRLQSLGGLRMEGRSNNGISNLTMGLLEKGTAHKSALQISEICETMAGHIDSFSGRNSWGIAGSFLAEKKSLGIDLFCDILCHPRFDPEEIKKEKRLTLESIKNHRDSLSHVAFEKFQAQLYPRHPYGMPALGTPGSVKRATRAAIQEFYRKLLDPRSMVISAVGDFDSEELLEALSAHLRAMPSAVLKLPKLAQPSPPAGIKKLAEHKKKMQTHIVVGFLGTTIHSRDRYALEVLNKILAGQGGRLFLELRDKLSLAYTVTSTMVEGIEPGFFAVYIGTDPSKKDRAIAGILKELQKVRAQPVSKEELEYAQAYIVGNYELDLQRGSAVATTLATNAVYGMGLEEFKKYPERIMQVTPREVLGVAKKYLKLNRYVLSVVGP